MRQHYLMDSHTQTLFNFYQYLSRCKEHYSVILFCHKFKDTAQHILAKWWQQMQHYSSDCFHKCFLQAMWSRILYKILQIFLSIYIICKYCVTIIESLNDWFWSCASNSRLLITIETCAYFTMNIQCSGRRSLKELYEANMV